MLNWVRRFIVDGPFFMDPVLSSLNRQFLSLDDRSRELLATIDGPELFIKPREIVNSMAMFSCGEYLLRSAGMVEKTFGGIMTRMWDDPFEWTLPEKLSSAQLIKDYFDEVEATRLKGFLFFKSDADLSREIPSPEKLRPLIDILLETMSLAEHFQGRAFAVFQMISDKKLPRL